jgi:hypothetical protein
MLPFKDFAARFQVHPTREWAPLLGEATEAKGVVYARNTCPHCSSRLARFPTRSGKCPECQQIIVRVRGDDYVVYLLREEDAGLLRKEMDAYESIKRGDPEPVRQFHRAWMARYAALGLGARMVPWDGGRCGPCRALGGRVFEPAKAPELPLRECKYGNCACHYEPVIRR